MNPDEIAEAIGRRDPVLAAALAWVAAGGDAEGVTWSWPDLRDAVAQVQEGTR